MEVSVSLMMMVIVSYDVNTETSSGKRRLRHVAKICNDYGQRVQNSVFECLVDSTKLEEMKERLLKAYDENHDSLYFFNIGKKYENKVLSYGCKQALDLGKPVIF